MIRLQNVTYSYPEASTPVLRNLALEVEEGEFLLVGGPSGSGKSTLLRCFNGLVPHFYGGTLTGQIEVAGLDPVAAGPGEMSRHVGLVFQDPEAQCIAGVVEDELAFAMENYGLPEAEMLRRIEQVLAALGIAHLSGRRLETLSGGERQRVAIGAVLTLQPRLLVLDEPTSQLDPEGAAEVLEALLRLNRELGLTLVLSEHRLERVAAYAHRMLYLPGGDRPALQGTPREVLAQVELVPPLVALGRARGWQPLPLTVEEARSFLDKQVGLVDNGAAGSQPFHASRITFHVSDVDAPPVSASTMPFPAISVRSLSFSYNSRPALHDVNLEVGPGEVVALMGPNGAGKTTLLKLLVGLLRPREGEIKVAGLDTRRVTLEQLIAYVGYVPQNPNVLLFADTVAGELDFTLKQHKQGFSSYGNLPHLLGLDPYMERYPRDLSVGERQRVALAAILVADPQVILLDEPTRGLDYGQKEALVTFLRQQRLVGRAVLLATHDVELAARCADRLVILRDGAVEADGPVGTVMGEHPAFASQINRLYGDARHLTVEDAGNLKEATEPSPAYPDVEDADGPAKAWEPTPGYPTVKNEGNLARVLAPLPASRPRTPLTPWIVALASLTGLVAFFYPFFSGTAQAGGEAFLAHAADAPVVTLLCLVAILAGLEVRGLGSKQVALLGIMAAIGAILRPVPGPGGFNILFFLPILCGYAVGPTFGFLLGAVTLLVSALLTGGIGPWLPYQMLSTGWVGMLAGWLPSLRRWRWGEVAVLATFSLVLGLFFGAMMNLWFWPFLGVGANSQLLWQPGLSFVETLQRYARHYLATSLAWDMGRGLGNAALIVLVGAAVLKLLRRFTKRFAFRRS